MRSSTLGRHMTPVAIYPDPQALGEALAQVILDGILQAACDGKPYLLGCPGGRSAVSTYQAIGRLAAEAGADLSHVVIVMMDEYLFRIDDEYVYCPPDAHYSCHRFAYEEIQDVINRALPPAHRVTRDHVWFPDPNMPADYDARICHAGGIDLFITATGASDGHVAFNPPGDPLDSDSRVVPLADSTRTDNMVTFPDFTDLSEVPGYGVSIGLGSIAALSRQVVLIAHGEDKQYAVRQLAAHGDFTPAWPASFIFCCPHGRIMLDEAAAVRLGDDVLTD